MVRVYIILYLMIALPLVRDRSSNRTEKSIIFFVNLACLSIFNDLHSIKDN